MIYQIPYDIIAVTGADQDAFLQGQITSDIHALKPDSLQLAACCEVNGRAVASMLMLREAERILLLLPTGMGAVLCAHLEKYAVFSKVTLSAITDTYVYGSLDIFEGALALPGNPGRFIAITDTAMADTSTDISAWQQANIEAHFALTPTALSSQLIPLMLNYVALEGISFDKGCYVGQEIIARMYYKSQLKRHLQVIKTEDLSIKIGDSLQNEQEQALGLIISQAKMGGKLLALALIQDRALDMPLFTANKQGVSIQAQE